MKANRRRLVLMLVLVAVALALPTPCQSATSEEIKKEIRRIDTEVSRIDREIAAMKKELAQFEGWRSRIQSALFDPKVYVIWYWAPTMIHGEDFYYLASEAQAKDIAEYWTLKSAIRGEKTSASQVFEEIKKFSKKYKGINLRQDLRKIVEMIPKIKEDITEHEKEKERLVDRFHVLLNTKPESERKVSGIPSEPPETWKECEDSSVRICGTWTYNDFNQTFNAVWDNGAQATLKLTKFDSQGVRIRRNDQAGASKGLQAEYTGRITPTGIADGKVTWVWGDRSWSGTWSATW